VSALDDCARSGIGRGADEQTGRYLLTRIRSAIPRASLRLFLSRKPACSAAAACHASMQITGQPCRYHRAPSLPSSRTGPRAPPARARDVVDPHPLVERVQVWVIDDLDHVVEPVLDDRRAHPLVGGQKF
jgi:hypothetical protein